MLHVHTYVQVLQINVIQVMLSIGLCYAKITRVSIYHRCMPRNKREILYNIMYKYNTLAELMVPESITKHIATLCIPAIWVSSSSLLIMLYWNDNGLLAECVTSKKHRGKVLYICITNIVIINKDIVIQCKNVATSLLQGL